MIREASSQDKHSLEEFLVENSAEEDRPLAQAYIKTMFSNDYRRPVFIIFEEDNEIIAAAAYSEEFFTVGVWGISWVCVRQDKRNKGIGQKIMNECLSRISQKAQKKVTVILNTYPDKTGLYDKLGFVPGGKDHEGGSLMLKYI